VKQSVLGVLILLCASIASAQLQRVKAEVTPLLASDGAHAGDAVRAALTVALPEHFHVQSNKPRDPDLIPTELSIDAPPGVTVKEIVFPPTVDFSVQGIAQPLAVFERTFVVGVELTVGRDVKAGALEIPARLRYQACNETSCFAPTTATTSWTLTVVPPATAVHPANRDVIDRIAFGRGDAPATTAAPVAIAKPASAPSSGAVPSFDGFVTAGTTGGYQGSVDFLKFIHDAESGVQQRGMFEGRGPLAIALLVLLGGLALNLTPCVLPMIPINLAIIGAGAQAGSRGRGFVLGGVYGAAMAVVYGALGVVVILTAGTFGTINASPWFNLGIAVLFVALALAMFDVITIDFSKFSSGMRLGEQGRGTLVLAFLMGAVAALLAGACVAPVVIQVVLFSSNLYAKGASVALALPFLLGIGMAVPWPVAGAGIAALPKPGAWMVRVKQVFGVVILVTAAYYGYESYSLFADRFVDASAVTSSVDAQVRAGWHRSLDEGLATAAREHKPVLIDMWATWCKNCLTMDQTTLKDAGVVSALEGYVKIKFQAENPDEQPAKGVMQRFDAVGLPAYVILHPKP